MIARSLVLALLLSGCAVGNAPAEPSPVVEDAGVEDAAPPSPDAGVTLPVPAQGVWYPDAAPAVWSDDAGWVNPTAAVRP